MGSDNLKIPKQLTEVRLWVHPEGIVEGCLFLSLEHENMRPEDPLVVLNEPTPFIVVRRNDPREIRFYNKSSIVRVQYEGEGEVAPDAKPLHCAFHMMDGSLIRGEIRRALPPDNGRLYDFLNLADERYAKMYIDGDVVCLVNKAYIVCVTAEQGA